MAFDIEAWKERATASVRGIGDLLKRATSGTPYVVYGALCTLSLWPLVEAARQGELLPVMMALGGVAGSVGGNLIANQIQASKDKADADGQNEMGDWIATEVPVNEELRNALDAINEQLGTMNATQKVLDSQQITALRQELQALGNLPRFEAVLTGGSAFAQGAGAQAVAQGGMLVTTGNMHGDINFGPVHKEETHNYFGATQPTEIKPTDSALLSGARVDFVLVTALAEERDAVLDKLPGWRQLPPSEATL